MARRIYEDWHRINVDGKEEKKCNKCSGWFEMNNENYGRDKRNSDGFYNSCRICQRAYNSKIYQQDPDKVKARTFEYRKKNPEKYKEHIKTRNQTSIHKERHRKVEQTRRDNGIFREWQRNNKDKVKAYSDTRQHKKHIINKKEWTACKTYFNNACAYCGLPITEHYRMYAGKHQKSDLHKEHVDHYGTNGLENCVPACLNCNSQKWKHPFDEWYNKNNINYTDERYNKIIKWLQEDYKKYIVTRKEKVNKTAVNQL